MFAPVRQEFEDNDDTDWTEKFIQTVQTKPPIYDNSLPEHCDRNVISCLWNEICETMFPMWQDMTSEEKSIKEKELQSKWRNLRTCFRRELNKQKHRTAGQTAKKRRKYVYFNQLLFLLPIIKDRPAISECSPCTMKGESETEDDLQHTQNMDQVKDNHFNNTSQISTFTQQSATMPINNQSQAKTKKKPVYEELLTISKENKEEQIDEDKSFLLSLVPLFRKLNDVQKLEAKMEFLATLKGYISVHPKNKRFRFSS